ncbi:MAG: hypothetical protein K2X63_02425 [Burkholderiaceae bacterium]|nr:hypothetical protein [Burkholderiaceae bacterium]
MKPEFLLTALAALINISTLSTANAQVNTSTPTDDAAFKAACHGTPYSASRVVMGKTLLTCSAEKQLHVINAQKKIDASYATGAHPLMADVTDDGVLAFVPNQGANSVTVIDLLNQKIVSTTPVCKTLQGGAVAPDNVSYIVNCNHADDKKASNPYQQYINTATFSVVPKPQAPIEVAVGKHGRLGQPNEVVIMGMIHGEHLTSKRYGLKTIAKLLRKIDPDVALVEIPPNRFEVADQQFKKTGKITEERVEVFPEYIDVMFPLRKEIGYQIVPTAGWSEAMNTYRSAAMKRISSDPARAKEWADYQNASQRSEAAVKQGGAEDDPAWIHTDAYDQALDIELSAYNHFDPELGRGGWDTINQAHYGNIERWLDQHKNQGKRVLITYGSAHKGWFTRHLRQRTDIKLLSTQDFLRE